MKDNFDDILKKKWEQFHFDVDDQHRKDMILLLDKSRRRKTGLFWWLGGIATGLAIVILLISTKQPMSAITPPTLNQQSIHPAIPADKASNGTDIKNEQELVQNSTHTPNDPLTAEVNKSEIESSSKTPPNTTVTIGDNASQKIKLSKSSKPDTNKNAIELQSTAGTKKSFNPSNANPSGIIADYDKNNKTPSGAEVENVSSAMAVEHDQQLREEVENTNAAADARRMDGMLPIRNETFITDPIDALQIQFLELYRDLPEATVPASTFRKSLSLFAEAGAGIVPGMQSEYKTGWTLRGGAGLLYNVSVRNSVSLSSGYLMQDGGFDFDKTSTVQTNSFGFRSSFNSLSPDRLHFIYGRVGVHHSIKRHMLSIFGGTQFLYGAQGQITIQTHDAIAGATEQTSHAWLKLDGMRRWLWSAEVQYGYRITPRIALHAGLKYFFTNIEATDPELQTQGYYWNGKMAQFNPFFTINYQLYERN